MRETPSLESVKEEETFSSLAVMEKKRFPQCRLSFYEESFLAREKQFLKE